MPWNRRSGTSRGGAPWRCCAQRQSRTETTSCRSPFREKPQRASLEAEG